MPARTKLALLLGLTIVVVAGSLSLGEVNTNPLDFWQIVTGSSQTDTAAFILTEIRMPRVLAAFCVGAMLALAGTLMQILLRNPLADPYILGISGGSAVFVLLGMMSGLGALWLDALAITGASLSTLVVFILGFRAGFGKSDRLLLTGVVIAAGWGALISLLLSVSTDLNLRGMVFWLMGDLGHSPATSYQWLFLLVIAGVIFQNRESLNLMMRGEEAAATLGVPVARMKLLLFVSASVLTALAVSIAGSIGFIGLIIPHLMRFFVGANHTYLIPASILFGGSFLVAADTLARTLITAQSIPVGAITAILGVPLFLFLLKRNL